MGTSTKLFLVSAGKMLSLAALVCAAIVIKHHFFGLFSVHIGLLLIGLLGVAVFLRELRVLIFLLGLCFMFCISFPPWHEVFRDSTPDDRVYWVYNWTYYFPLFVLGPMVFIQFFIELWVYFSRRNGRKRGAN